MTNSRHGSTVICVREPLDVGEQQARSILAVELGERLTLVRRAFDLVAEVLNVRPEEFVPTQAFKVGIAS